jgi:hypothetical protein
MNKLYKIMEEINELSYKELRELNDWLNRKVLDLMYKQTKIADIKLRKTL